MNRRRTFSAAALLFVAGIGVAPAASAAAGVPAAAEVAATQAGEVTSGSAALPADSFTVQDVKEGKDVDYGVWNYGRYPTRAYSNYYHESKCHGSSAYLGDRSARDFNVAPGKESQAGVNNATTATAEVYWRSTGDC
ncbi:lactococcin 972 family bacteriocin [Lentzea sp. NPDC004789]